MVTMKAGKAYSHGELHQLFIQIVVKEKRHLLEQHFTGSGCSAYRIRIHLGLRHLEITDPSLCRLFIQFYVFVCK